MTSLFAKRVGLVSISKIIVMLGSIVLLPVLTKNLSISDYALWVQILVFIGFITPLVDLGLSTAMLRFFPAENNKTELRNKFYTILVIILSFGLLISIIMLILSPYIAHYFFSKGIEIIYYIPPIFMVLVLNNLSMSYFRSRQQIKRLSFFTVVQTIIVTGFVTFMVILNPSLSETIKSYLIAQTLLLLTMLFLINKEIGIGGTFNLKYLNEYLPIGLPTIPMSLVSVVVTGSDRLLIGMFMGISYVGYYSPAYGLGSSVMLFMAPFGTLLPAALSELHDKGKIKDMWATLKHTLMAFLILAIPSGIVVSIFARNILELLTTPDIAANSYQIVPIIVLSTIIYSVQAIISNVLIVEKKMLILAFIIIISAAISLSSNFILIPKFGLIGAAISLTIAYTVQMFIVIHVATKSLNTLKL